MVKNTQIISKERVAEHGEVFTAQREVNAMLDLVNQETERIESRFLEPTCGKGIFLEEVLRRKLKIVKKRYKSSPEEFERYSLLALSSLYGIDILEDNIKDCRENLLKIFKTEYKKAQRKKCSIECEAIASFLLSKNIIWGDALTLHKVDNPNEPIIFSEWSLFRGSLVIRKDFIFSHLINKDANCTHQFSDTGKLVWLPQPIKEFPLTHYLRIADAE